MIDPVRNRQHGDRNDNEVAQRDQRRHEERERLEREAKKRDERASGGPPPRR